ncbi:hypothetical protein NA8A_17915 [Nitratireductor indicus C115]|uniref:Uncharacterized protein n=1 Tax=Nitratireductor indicus C115 TaxID=1231190 RepID=K2NNW4_9HYPH|nr:hypothetical protein NA8A_17915 [Nitratireductor indicus C115]
MLCEGKRGEAPAPRVGSPIASLAQSAKPKASFANTLVERRQDFVFCAFRANCLQNRAAVLIRKR